MREQLSRTACAGTLAKCYVSDRLLLVVIVVLINLLLMLGVVWRARVGPINDTRWLFVLRDACDHAIFCCRIEHGNYGTADDISSSILFVMPAASTWASVLRHTKLSF